VRRSARRQTAEEAAFVVVIVVIIVSHHLQTTLETETTHSTQVIRHRRSTPISNIKKRTQPMSHAHDLSECKSPKCLLCSDTNQLMYDTEMTPESLRAALELVSPSAQNRSSPETRSIRPVVYRFVDDDLPNNDVDNSNHNNNTFTPPTRATVKSTV
jgi:hypothetical protein